MRLRKNEWTDEEIALQLKYRRTVTSSHYFRRHPLNLRHIVVKNGLLAAIIPFDCYARPILFSDGALIISISVPANAVADVKLSGLVAGHFHHWCELSAASALRNASLTASSRVLVVFSGPFGIFIANH
jgi:hypothetical protein